MYNPTQMRYLLGESARGLLRRKISGSVAVVIMGSALLTLALFSLVTINLDRALQTMGGNIDMTVFLLDDIHEQDRSRLEADLLQTRGVNRVRYVSRESALERFRLELGHDAGLLDALTVNPLPASLEIELDASAQKAEQIEALRASVAQYPGVEEIVADVAWVKRLESLTRGFVIVDFCVGLLVLISALFVISNTVRLTIEESAQQVEIMKLVGATNWFIRAPYVLGGAFQGLAAGTLAMVVLLMAVRVVEDRVEGIVFFHSGQMFGFVLLSTMLGAIGSMVALRRHLTLR